VKYVLNLKIYCLITFPNTHSALQAEKVLQEAEAAFIIIPVPRAISSGCGLSIKIPVESRNTVLCVLQDKGVTFDHVYKIDKKAETIDKIV
jgi:hypothetical protein